MQISAGMRSVPFPIIQCHIGALLCLPWRTARVQDKTFWGFKSFTDKKKKKKLNHSWSDYEREKRTTKDAYEMK